VTHFPESVSRNPLNISYLASGRDGLTYNTAWYILSMMAPFILPNAEITIKTYLVSNAEDVARCTHES